jgi:hypothetical protein
MTHQLRRTQVLLETEQHEALGEIARRQGRSLSDLLREIVRGYLLERAQGEEKLRGLAALQELSRLREENRRQYGVYQGDLIAEVRAEREIPAISSSMDQEQP